jgi:DNA primase
MDKYESVRALPFPALASALGLDLKRFKHRKEDWQGYCPIHQSKTNNNCFADNDDGRYHCFSCNAKGRGGIDLAMAVKGVNFTQACEILGAAPKEPPKQKEPPVSDSGASDIVSGDSADYKPLAKDTWRKFAVPCPWLEARIPDAAVRERYGVFCYENKARKSVYSSHVMLPIKDVQGVLYGYLGRYIGDSAPSTTSGENASKYLFPKNLPKSRFLFGAHEIAFGLWRNGPQTSIAGQGPSQYVEALPLKRVYLVESPFCVMRFAMYGLPAVSPFGWSVSEDQISLLRTICKGLVYLPDRNKTEEAAAQCACIANTLWVRFPPLPDGIDDPEQMTKEQILAL